MKKTELIFRLTNLEIPQDSYSLDGGFPSETFVVSKNIIGWEFYYSERGSKTGQVNFHSEEEAYDYLHEVLKNEKGKNYF
ncbi:hypothetical protein [Dyadobacter pollutisoli]|uniref:Uncharacterized protein n=1 Tax=Dyadobacter pollutisoli TaxID=2910158 RepID=A0A9E8NDH9_9BACT|nr:hypothetical protein [Dyadobacter pollutisoli]WAC12491.1 hypothetical protein ON006_00725 [Dyadobacter pollutisoli]